MFKSQPSYWHMLLPVLALHGLLLACPIGDKPDLEAKLKQGKPIRVVKLPPKPLTALPRLAKPKVNLSSAQRTSLLNSKPKVAVQKTTVTLPKADAPAPKPTTQPSPPPVGSKPSPAPTSSPIPSASPTPANELQMEGATTGCIGSGTKDCFTLTQTNGRLFAQQIEEHFKDKGYDLNKQDLDDEHGMTVYQLSKQGSPKDYLHVLWDEQGTTYLRFPKVLNHQELTLMARSSAP
jgi:hypothetical protein